MSQRNNRNKRGSKRGRKKKRIKITMKSRIDKLEDKLREIKPEYKYTYKQVQTVSGQSTDTTNSFYANNTGYIKHSPLVINQGAGTSQRVGDEVILRRLFIQMTVRWPLRALTPLWNGRDSSVTSNAGLNNTGDYRGDLPVKISIIRMNHADGAFASFQTYMEGFKRMYSLKENMANVGVQQLKKQELKILATKSFKLKRMITPVLDTGVSPSAANDIIVSMPTEVAFNIPLEDKLLFDPSPSSQYAQNYRYAFVVQFGHQADLFQGGVSKYYAPVVTYKWNYWYTDN